MGLSCMRSERATQISSSSSSVPMPPGSVRNASAAAVHLALALAHVVGDDELVGPVVGDLELDQRARDDADGVRPAGAGGTGDGPHAADRAAAADQRPAAAGEREAHLAGEHGVPLGDVLAGGAEHGDRRHLRPPRAGTTSGGGSTGRAPAWAAAMIAHDLVEVVGEVHEVEVLRRDLALGEHRVAQPAEQAAPVRRAHEHDGERRDLAGLHQGERLEQLVEGAEAAGEDDERLGVLHEHRLAREEVAEVDADVDPLVHALLERQLDAEPDRRAARLAGTACWPPP